ncbi:MAG: oxidoreductase, partial [Candidatus Staskawiczbacteria bacterium]
MKKLEVMVTGPSADYELLDSGEGEKLERYGKVVLSRPDPQALWRRNLPLSQWKEADAFFYRSEEKSGWKVKMGMPKEWI